MVVIAVLVIALPLLNQTGSEIAQRVNPPNGQVTSQNLRTGTSGFDYIAYVDVTVYNNGGPGTVVVWAEVWQGSSHWTKSTSIYMSEKSSQSVTLTFSEITLLSLNDIQYSSWIG